MLVEHTNDVLLTYTHPLATSQELETAPLTAVEECSHSYDSNEKVSTETLQDSVTIWIKHREELINMMKEFVNILNEHHKNSQIAQIVGTSTALVGSALSVVGFGLSLMTMGGSLILTVGGAAVAGVGGATKLGASIFDWSVGLQKAKIIQQKLNVDAQLYNDMAQKLHHLAVVKEEHSLDRDVLLDGVIEANGKKVSIGKLIQGMTKSVLEQTNGHAVAQGVRVSTGAFSTAATVATGVSPMINIGGLVFSVVAVPFDVYFLVKDAKNLHDKTPSDVAATMQPVIEKLEAELMNVLALSEYGDDLEVDEEPPSEI
jgi:hypothetical protein